MSINTEWFTTFPRHTFNSYSYYLKSLYKQRVYRISVDAGFTCPHRERSINNSGCLYCSDHGSRAPYLGSETDIRSQIDGTILFLKKRYNAHVYILFFQAYSNTNAPPEKLKSIYDFALDCAPFKELIVSTRPDCIDEEKAKLLTSYKDRGLKVWVELGLQSASDDTLIRINRKHTVKDYLNAYALLKKYGISITTHLIFGLPGEGEEEIMKSVEFVADLNPDGIKIHNLHIRKSSPLFKTYLNGEIVLPSAERHRDYVISALEYLPQETVIMRLTCDTPRDDLASPLSFWNKSRFYEEVRKEMEKRNTWQGKKYTGYISG
ncbi:MAG: TIGR01212 family radical SAM protein [Spirochaetales bacterium]|nr:TIGR01212 family radical SAM protein [Spirochaetales bacterium]